MVADKRGYQEDVRGDLEVVATRNLRVISEDRKEVRVRAAAKGSMAAEGMRRMGGRRGGQSATEIRVLAPHHSTPAADSPQKEEKRSE